MVTSNSRTDYTPVPSSVPAARLMRTTGVRPSELQWIAYRALGHRCPDIPGADWFYITVVDDMAGAGGEVPYREVCRLQLGAEEARLLAESIIRQLDGKAA